MVRALLAVADGSEDIETVATLDTLRRCGIEVILASVADREVLCANGTKLVADAKISEVSGDFDAIVVPGGKKGSEACRDCPQLIELLKAQKTSGKVYAAICAAPAIVFATHGILDGVSQAVCYPVKDFQDALGEKYKKGSRVVVDGNCITSIGPGSTIEFGLAIAAKLVGEEKATEVGKAMQLS
eukprot:GEMP01078011.1.p1 GENE.GEMP01078011.1~~GEMP01078011.1.p1  ORF type:complete len:185 (+),score=46.38 GEMP01078011.1:57-611(+)